MRPFISKDYEEQFNEKVRLIEEEEQKELKKREFILAIQNHPRIILRRNTQIDDYDYQNEIDSELSLISQGAEIN